MTTDLPKTITLPLADEAATLGLGDAIAQALHPPLVVFLRGDLGAGKTTLSRGLVQGLGHQGSVKSPTYTIVEPYNSTRYPVYHFDLYRLGDPEELEYLGLRDYLAEQAVILMEWPERGGPVLPPPDLEISLEPECDGRSARLTANTEPALALLAHIRL